MKKLIFAVVLSLAMALTSYGNPANKNTELLKGLTAAIQNANASSLSKDGKYKNLSFDFNGKAVKAYYDVESDELIGFSIPITAKDLPAGSLENIKRKFANYTSGEAIMFVYKSGYFGFYIAMTQPQKPSIVVDVNAKGKAHYFAKM